MLWDKKEFCGVRIVLKDDSRMEKEQKKEGLEKLQSV
jgi:hypothetical protein